MYLAIEAIGQRRDPFVAAHTGPIERVGAGIESN
jgi:hypothetical protein